MVAGDLYYMDQTIGNACGTIGLLHAIANQKDTMEKDGFPLGKKPPFSLKDHAVLRKKPLTGGQSTNHLFFANCSFFRRFNLFFIDLPQATGF